MGPDEAAVQIQRVVRGGLARNEASRRATQRADAEIAAHQEEEAQYMHACAAKIQTLVLKRVIRRWQEASLLSSGGGSASASGRSPPSPSGASTSTNTRPYTVHQDVMDLRDEPFPYPYSLYNVGGALSFAPSEVCESVRSADESRDYSPRGLYTPRDMWPPSADAGGVGVLRGLYSRGSLARGDL